jgi:hypothetical protein
VEDGEPILHKAPPPTGSQAEAHEPPAAVRVFRKTHSYLLFHLANSVDAWKQRADAGDGEDEEFILSGSKVDPSPYVIRKLARESGDRLLVLMINNDPALAAWCQEHGIPVTAMDRALRHPGPHTYPKGPPKHGHWTPEGNRRAARDIREAVLPLLGIAPEEP